MVWAIGPVGPLGPPGGYVWSIVLGIGPTGPIGGPGGNVWSIATRDMGLHCCQSAASTPQLPGKMRLRVRASRNRKAMTPSKVRVRRRPAYDRLVLSDVIYLALRPKPREDWRATLRQRAKNPPVGAAEFLSPCGPYSSHSRPSGEPPEGRTGGCFL